MFHRLIGTVSDENEGDKVDLGEGEEDVHENMEQGGKGMEWGQDECPDRLNDEGARVPAAPPTMNDTPDTEVSRGRGHYVYITL